MRVPRLALDGAAAAALVKACPPLAEVKVDLLLQAAVSLSRAAVAIWRTLLVSQRSLLLITAQQWSTVVNYAQMWSTVALAVVVCHFQ